MISCRTSSTASLETSLSEEPHQKLKQLQDLLAHQIPNRDPAAIIERALDVLLPQVHKRKTGITEKPRPKVTSALVWLPGVVMVVGCSRHQDAD